MECTILGMDRRSQLPGHQLVFNNVYDRSDYSTQHDIWVRLFPSPSPSPEYADLMSTIHFRHHHTLSSIIVDGVQVFVLFGGYKNGAYLNDTYALTVDCDVSKMAMQWNVITAYNSSTKECTFQNFDCTEIPDGPSERAGHAVISSIVGTY